MIVIVFCLHLSALNKLATKQIRHFPSPITRTHPCLSPLADLESSEKLLEQRQVLRIVTSSFPRYFAIVSRPIENAIMIGADGGNIESTVVPGARAFFPEGALTKRITIALQVLFTVFYDYKSTYFKRKSKFNKLELKSKLFTNSQLL